MSRLIVFSPPFIGTSGSDLLVGKEDNVLPVALGAQVAIGIQVLKNGLIDTQAGNDTIEGSSIGGNSSGEILDTGIVNSGIINAGTGDDTIFGTGTGAQEPREEESGIGISNTQGGYINGGDGNDLIKGTETGGENNFIILNTGINNTQHSRIDGGFGDDSIEGTGIGEGNIFDDNSSFTGISNTEGSDINGGDGNDSIKGTADAVGFISSGTGILNSGSSVISGGFGNDSIIGIGKGGGAALDPYRGDFPAGEGIGISNSLGSLICTGQGNDLISGTGTGGAEDDAGSFGMLGPGVGIGIVNSGIISLGTGNDTIIGTGISLGIGIVNTNGIIYGGAGDDTLAGYGISIGIQGGTIDGGSGNDYFKARRIDANGNPISNQGGDIADVLIKGGCGDDTFDVGYGNATINGGSGWDKLILPDLKSDYIITGNSNNYTVKRDQFTLNVLNVEQIDFLGVTPQHSVLGILN
ncbi:MAG: hypothetical protein V7L20_20150 [Nostoc sp.]|uniref:hypothetical protein n=1 Tax=Nostoc sp. TaxID=1180 RepID=UPI002FF94A0B